MNFHLVDLDETTMNDDEEYNLDNANPTSFTVNKEKQLIKTVLNKMKPIKNKIVFKLVLQALKTHT